MDRQWYERVADAALRAADELRALDDPTTFGLVADLAALHARLSAASGLGGEAA